MPDVLSTESRTYSCTSMRKAANQNQTKTCEYQVRAFPDAHFVPSFRCQSSPIGSCLSLFLISLRVCVSAGTLFGLLNTSYLYKIFFVCAGTPFGLNTILILLVHKILYEVFTPSGTAVTSSACVGRCTEATW